MRERCPFCKLHPYEYADVGVGMVPVAVNCCDLGNALMQHGKKVARQTLANMRSHSPRRKSRAMRVLREYGLRDEKQVRKQGVSK